MTSERSSSLKTDVRQQIFIVISVGILLVATLFMTTIVSKRISPPDSVAIPTSSAPPAQIPLSGAIAERIAEIDNAIAGDTSDFALLLKREKVFILAEGNRSDLAAALQTDIAEETNLPEDWKTAGDLYYGEMTDEPQSQLRLQIANQAVSAYQRVLELTPDNLDVRTDMATAYLNTDSPMLGVTEIKKVLEADPRHLNANFNYGLMLARINRTEEAVSQLELVLTLASDSTSMHYQRARELIGSIQKQSGL